MTVDDDLPGVARALHAHFPDAGRIEPVRVVSSGFRSLAVAGAGGQLFRVGKVSGAAAGYAREARLLPLLCGHLPMAIPQPRWYAGPSASFPFGVIGYPMLVGRPLDPTALAPSNEARLAGQLGAFLVALHHVALPEGVDFDVTDDAPERAVAARWRDEVLPPLRDALTAREYATVVRWWDRFEVERRVQCNHDQPVLRHGDLWYENVLVDDTARTVVGIIDFEGAAWGDPAQDFAVQHHLGARFASLVMGAYRAAGGDIDANLANRARWLWELRELDGLRDSARHGNWAEFAASVVKLRQGPTLSAAASSR